MDDDDLLAAAARGDGDAFAAFYRRHGDLVLGYLRKRVADPEQAFDLAAETFAAALVSLRRYRPGRGPAAGWLLGIAQHKLLESLRRGRVEASARRRLHHEPIALDDDDLLAIEARAASGALSLERLLTELPVEQREAITARVLDERGYAEIAFELRCSPQVVRQRVSRGLRTLRTQIGDRP
jgi:RNA polymerase sigma-70 factor (ECF subfamily)